MNTGIDRRRHPRVPLVLPVVLMTPQGAIEGKTANISVGGLALILFLEKPKIGNKFQRMILHHLMTVDWLLPWITNCGKDEKLGQR